MLVFYFDRAMIAGDKAFVQHRKNFTTKIGATNSSKVRHRDLLQKLPLYHILQVPAKKLCILVYDSVNQIGYAVTQQG